MTQGAIALLLTAAACCLGARHVADLRRSEDRRGKVAAAAMRVPVVDDAAGRAARMTSLPGDSAEAAMTRRLRLLLSTGDAAELARSLLALTGHFQPEDWPLAFQALHEMGLSRSNRSYRLILEAWVKNDRTAAMAWSERTGGLTVALREWRQTDPDAVLAWLRAPERIHDTNWEQEMRTSIPPPAKDMAPFGRALEGLPAEQISNILRAGHVSFNGVSPEELLAWVDGLDPAAKKEMTNGLMDAVMVVEKKLAVADANPELVDPAKYQRVCQQWAGQNLEAATAELEGLGPGARHRGLLAGVAEKEVGQGNCEQALAWMRRLPDDIPQDRVYFWISAATKDHPEQAAEMLGMTSEPWQRASGYRSLLSTWFENDPGAARQWLDGHGEVPDTVRQEFEGK